MFRVSNPLPRYGSGGTIENHRIHRLMAQYNYLFCRSCHFLPLFAGKSDCHDQLAIINENDHFFKRFPQRKGAFDYHRLPFILFLSHSDYSSYI
jgi:hypothetical protein